MRGSWACSKLQRRKHCSRHCGRRHAMCHVSSINAGVSVYIRKEFVQLSPASPQQLTKRPAAHSSIGIRAGLLLKTNCRILTRRITKRHLTESDSYRVTCHLSIGATWHAARSLATHLLGHLLSMESSHHLYGGCDLGMFGNSIFKIGGSATRIGFGCTTPIWR